MNLQKFSYANSGAGRSPQQLFEDIQKDLEEVQRLKDLSEPFKDHYTSADENLPDWVKEANKYDWRVSPSFMYYPSISNLGRAGTNLFNAFYSTPSSYQNAVQDAISILTGRVSISSGGGVTIKGGGSFGSAWCLETCYIFPGTLKEREEARKNADGGGGSSSGGSGGNKNTCTPWWDSSFTCR